ncbi:MAG: response regulator, partial [Oscillospiraceae bacterium]|nr:response regulator [Oscillospiraceae bacterium]
MNPLQLHVAVVEDEKTSRDKLKGFLQRFMEENNLIIEITEFEDGIKIVESYRPVFDVIFLDIEMPQMNGMKAAEIIRKKDEHVILVFI